MRRLALIFLVLTPLAAASAPLTGSFLFGGDGVRLDEGPVHLSTSSAGASDCTVRGWNGTLGQCFGLPADASNATWTLQVDADAQPSALSACFWKEGEVAACLVGGDGVTLTGGPVPSGAQHGRVGATGGAGLRWTLSFV